jgi:hypothetical protein
MQVASAAPSQPMPPAPPNNLLDFGVNSTEIATAATYGSSPVDLLGFNISSAPTNQLHLIMQSDMTPQRFQVIGWLNVFYTCCISESVVSTSFYRHHF